MMKRRLEGYTQKGWCLSLRNIVIFIVISFSFILIMSGNFKQNAYANGEKGNSSKKERKVQIKEGDEWRYFKGKKKPSKKWKDNEFDDSNWQKGYSGFGYGKKQENDKNNRNKTDLTDMKGNYSTIYVRNNFIIKNAHKITNMILSVDCDGPFVAYLNGIEILRNESGLSNERFDISGFIHEMFPGENILAIEGNNDDMNSDTFTFIPEYELTENESNGTE